jgi:hypothetical protein
MGQDSTLWDYLGLSNDMGLLDGHYQMIWDY